MEPRFFFLPAQIPTYLVKMYEFGRIYIQREITGWQQVSQYAVYVGWKSIRVPAGT